MRVFLNNCAICTDVCRPKFAFDGDIHTKWLDYAGQPSDLSLKPYAQWAIDLGAYARILSPFYQSEF